MYGNQKKFFFNIAPQRPKIQRRSEDRELNQARSKTNPVNRPVRTAPTIVEP